MRFFFRLFLVRWLLVLMVVPGVCSALDPTPMQKSVAALIQSKAAQRGISASDPRLNPTMNAIGSSVAGTAAAAAVVTAAGVTAPAWITAAVVMGLGALFTAGISLAVDKIAAWWFDSDGSIKVAVPSSAPSAVDYSVPVYPKNPADAAACSTSMIYNWCDETGPSYSGCLPPWAQNPTNSCRPGWAPDGKTSTTFVEAMDRAGYSYTLKTPPAEMQTKTAADAVASLTEEEKAAPLNPQVLAAIADQAWKTASEQPGYDGIPYSSSHPITTADAVAVQQASPATYPTVGDAVAPVAAPAGQPSAAPWTPAVSAPVAQPQPQPQPEPGETTNPDSKPIDWGVFTPPTLEGTPTIESILDPLFNLWPAWSSFSFPAHQSECPTPSFSLPNSVLNGHTLHFTQMCDFLEANNVRVAMQAAFAVAWAILILFIVMGA